MLEVRFRLTGNFSTIVLPPERTGHRRDELWKTTCFEVFVASGRDYREFNLSTASDWATYDFADYRSGMREGPPIVSPIQQTRTLQTFELAAFLPLPEAATRVGLSAVIATTDETKSYWALQHPPGPPDFHDPACFVLELSPPRRA